MNEIQATAAGDQAFDPVMVVLLEQLWLAAREDSGKPWPLAKLAKRAGLPMSTLRRSLALLQSAGLVDFSVDENGRGSAWLTGQGQALCLAIEGGEPGGVG